jgi:hypothetical protein
MVNKEARLFPMADKEFAIQTFNISSVLFEF